MVNRLGPEQVQRNERGIAACRAAIGDVLARREQPEEDAAPLTRSDEIHAAARAHAARLRRQKPAIRRSQP